VAAGAAEEAGAAGAAAAGAGYITSVLRTGKGQTRGGRTHAAAPEEAPDEGVDFGLLTALPALPALLAAGIFATAAVISAAVASSTRRFCEKMQPSGSLMVSQVLPLPVVSVS
jgi:hypothetical protein